MTQRKEQHRQGQELASIPGEAGSGLKPNPEIPGSRRDPEERPASTPQEHREKALDKTLADSFPTSDPPSSIPDPAEDDSLNSEAPPPAKPGKRAA